MTLSDPRGWLPALVRWGFSPSDGPGPDLDARKWLKRVREANPQDITGWGRDLADRRAREILGELEQQELCGKA